MSDWTVAYDFVLYNFLSNSFKNAWIDIISDLLNVSKASKAWYLVTVVSFWNNLFKCYIVTSALFSVVISSPSISSTASSALSSRDSNSAELCLFIVKSVERLHTLMTSSQSSYVLHFNRDGDVLKLFDAIIAL